MLTFLTKCFISNIDLVHSYSSGQYKVYVSFPLHDRWMVRVFIGKRHSCHCPDFVLYHSGSVPFYYRSSVRCTVRVPLLNFDSVLTRARVREARRCKGVGLSGECRFVSWNGVQYVQEAKNLKLVLSRFESAYDCKDTARGRATSLYSGRCCEVFEEIWRNWKFKQA